jgi:hypothetical protein
MRAMKLSRLGAGTGLSLFVLTAWLGACSPNTDEACGNNGLKNGVCRQVTTCPSGSTEIPISDPSDMCPESNSTGTTSYICCASGTGTTGTTTGTGTGTGAGSGTGTSDSGSTAPVDSGSTTTADSGTTPAADAGSSAASDAATQG